MGKIFYSLTALVCLFAVTTAFDPRPSIAPPSSNPMCYREQLNRDMNFDLSFVCNDGRKYPQQEIDDALYYADDHWRMYLNLSSSCFNDKDNFFMNDYTDRGYYHLKSVCKTRRTPVTSVYTAEGLVCHVVHPHAQKIYYATCGGTCNLGYDGVTGYHCIPRGITHRKFLAYCEYLPDYAATKPLACLDPINGEYDPRTKAPTTRMQTEFLADGSMYKPNGYFTEVQVTLPSYCGCRGYFCNY